MDAYALAGFLAKRYGADTIIDIGCGSPPDLMGLDGFRRIGVAFGDHLEQCRISYPAETWIEADLDSESEIPIDAADVRRSVVICAGVIEHTAKPTRLIFLLRLLMIRARAIIVTTPERNLVRAASGVTPLGNRRALHEWSLEEFRSLLWDHSLEPSFLGLTFDDSETLQKSSILAILDFSIAFLRTAPPVDFRPLAVVATYNDRDMVLSTLTKLRDDGIDVHVLDNWSTDGTFELLMDAGFVAERFPSEGPLSHYEWVAILNRKDQIAQSHPGRWILHHDSDEIRAAPWADTSLRSAIFVAEQMGFNAIDFTVCDFRPVDSAFVEGMDLEKALRYFEFGTRPGHFVQTKVWRQGHCSVNLAAFGGHQVSPDLVRIFPYKFMLKHYPLRSPSQARHKIFTERRARFSPVERANGWHVHYDQWESDAEFLWDKGALIEFDEVEVRRRYLVELVSGIGIVR